MLRGKKLLLRGTHIRGVGLWLAACGPLPATTEPALVETDPFEAAAIQADVQRWESAMSDAERLVTHAAVSAERLEAVANRLRQQQDRALRQRLVHFRLRPGAPPSSSLTLSISVA